MANIWLSIFRAVFASAVKLCGKGFVESWSVDFGARCFYAELFGAASGAVVLKASMWIFHHMIIFGQGEDTMANTLSAGESMRVIAWRWSIFSMLIAVKVTNVTT